jgi:hypothetical protein
VHRYAEQRVRADRRQPDLDPVLASWRLGHDEAVVDARDDARRETLEPPRGSEMRSDGPKLRIKATSPDGSSRRIRTSPACSS